MTGWREGAIYRDGRGRLTQLKDGKWTYPSCTEEPQYSQPHDMALMSPVPSLTEELRRLHDEEDRLRQVILDQEAELQRAHDQANYWQRQTHASWRREADLANVVTTDPLKRLALADRHVAGHPGHDPGWLPPQPRTGGLTGRALRRLCRRDGGHYWHPEGMIDWYCCVCGTETDGMPRDGSRR